MRTDEPVTPAYRFAMGVSSPIVRQWGRLHVTGLELLPATGPVLVAANHDSYWDPITIGVAALGRRQIRALAKDELWKIPVVDRLLDGMGQIPVARGKSDEQAMSRAIEALRAGACIGIFPEGTRSRGQTLRARSGIGRLARAVPEARIVCAAASGTTDIPRFPTRPAVRVEFFAPAGGGIREDESFADFGARLLDELRARAPRAACGRRRSQITAP